MLMWIERNGKLGIVDETTEVDSASSLEVDRLTGILGMAS